MNIQVKNYQTRGSVKLVKTDKETGDAIAGVSFNLYNGITTVSTGLKTDTNGEIIVPRLLAGTYYFVETQPADGYVVSENNIYEFKIEVGNTQEVTVNVENAQKEGGVTLTLFDREDKTIVLPNGSYDLYRVTQQEVSKASPIQTGLITNENGQITIETLLPGDYYFVETSAPKGYLLDGELVTFTIEFNPEAMIYVEHTNTRIKGTLEITKYGSDDKLLAGVQFAIYDENREFVEYVTTGINGVATSNPLPQGDYYFVETIAAEGYLISSEEIEFKITTHEEIVKLDRSNQQILGNIAIYKTDNYNEPLQGVKFEVYDANNNVVAHLTTDENGKATTEELAYGSYKVVEVETIAGYILDRETKTVTLSVHEKTEVVTFINEKILGSLVIQKVDENEEPMEGVTFTLLDANGTFIETLVTDEKGIAQSGSLPYGSYTVKETKTVLGYILDEEERVFEVSERDSIEIIEWMNTRLYGSLEIRKYGENQNPLAGVQFDILQEDGELIETITTNENGIATSSKLPYGIYTFVEVETLAAYVLDETPVTFTITKDQQVVEKVVVNQLGRGDLTLLKFSRENRILLADAVFEVKDAQGNVVATLTTDADGLAGMTGLLYGEYTVTEVNPPEGYRLNDTPIPFVIDRENTSVFLYIANMPSRMPMEQLIFIKVLESTDWYQNPEAYKDVRYAIYANETVSIKNREGVVVRYEKGDFLVELFINDSGRLTFENFDLVPGEYYLQETATHKDYILDDTIYPFTVFEDEPVAIISTDPVTNYLKRSSVIVTKVDMETLEVLEGATFQLLDANFKAMDGYQATSDVDGRIVFEGLVNGTYYLQEVSAPVGYEVLTESIQVVVSGSDVTLTISNTLMPKEDVPPEVPEMVEIPPVETPPVETGAQQNTMYYVMLFCLSIFGTVLIIKKRKAKPNKKVS